jgi:hypothetical protein
MNILALDLATRTGWALQENGTIESGVQVFDVKRGESPGMRFFKFNKWLFQIAMRIDRREPLLVVFEQAHHRGGAATECAAGFSTRVLEFCAVHGFEHTSVHSATLKKFATGYGGKGAGKSAMIEAARTKLGVVYEDDNECDARWLLEYAKKEIMGG